MNPAHSSSFVHLYTFPSLLLHSQVPPPHEMTAAFDSSTHTSNGPAQSSGFVHLALHTPSAEHVASFLHSASFVHL